VSNDIWPPEDQLELWQAVSKVQEGVDMLIAFGRHHAFSVIGVSAISGDGQTGIVGAALSTPIRVRVTLPNGTTPVPNEDISFTSSGDGGFSSPIVQTDVNGYAQSTWILPTTPVGSHTATVVIVRNGRSATFGATANHDVPAALVATSADDQSGIAGNNVTSAPAAILVDQFGNVISGSTVTTAITAGGGTRSPTGSLTTDAGGAVALASWTLGSIGVNSLTFSSAGVPNLVFTANASPSAVATFIDIVSGGTQSGIAAGALYTSDITLKVTGPDHTTGVFGTSVTDSVIAGGGTPDVEKQTNASGLVTMKPRAGTVVGTNTNRFSFADVNGDAVSVDDSISTVAGPVAGLRFVQQPPSNMNSGQVMAPQPSVELIDTNGNRKLSGVGSGVSVALSIAPGSDASLTGTTSGSATAGLRTFSGVGLVDATGGASNIRATATVSSVVYTVDSNPVSASPPIPHHSVIVTGPPVTIPLGNSFPLVVDVVDIDNLRILGDASLYRVTLTNNTEGATLLNNGTATLTATCVDGRATFALSVTGFTPPGDFTILIERGTDNAFDITSSSFAVTAASTWPNDPGWTPMAENACNAEPFANSTATPGTATGILGKWGQSTAYPVDTVQVVTASSIGVVAPMSPNNLWQCRYPSGTRGGVGKWMIKAWDSTGTDGASAYMSKFYIAFWINLYGNGTNFEITPNGANIFKPFGYIGYGMPLAGIGGTSNSRNQGYWGASVPSPGFVTQVNLGFYQQNNVSRHCPNSTIMKVNTWYLMENLFEVNDLGLANGIWKAWKTELAGPTVNWANRTDMVYRTNNEVPPLPNASANDAGYINGFSLWLFNAIYVSGADNKTRADDILIDHVYMSGLP
jgi:hypothetical protein